MEERPLGAIGRKSMNQTHDTFKGVENYKSRLE